MVYILYYAPLYGLVTLYSDRIDLYKRTKVVLGYPANRAVLRVSGKGTARGIRNNLPFPWFSHPIICMLFEWADLSAGWG